MRRYGSGDTAVDALRGVSLSIVEGELTAIMGPSGSGKSTLMHLLAGLDRPTGGDVWIDELQIGELADAELTKLRRRHVGFIFQFFNLLPMLTAEENVTLPLLLAGEDVDRAHDGGGARVLASGQGDGAERGQAHGDVGAGAQRGVAGEQTNGLPEKLPGLAVLAGE